MTKTFQYALILALIEIVTSASAQSDASRIIFFGTTLDPQNVIK